jgi:hydroxymethylbilane synthase
MGEIDTAVHCMKDVLGDVPLPAGVVFAAYLPREDIRDSLVFPVSSPLTALADLPAGARIGTCSAPQGAARTPPPRPSRPPCPRQRQFPSEPP